MPRSRHKGRLLSDEQLSDPRKDPRLTPKERGHANASGMTPEHRKAERKRRRTELTFLRAMVKEFSADDAKELMEKVKQRALEGDAASLQFLGKYVFGGGRVSLADLYHPPMIRRTR